MGTRLDFARPVFGDRRSRLMQPLRSIKWVLAKNTHQTRKWYRGAKAFGAAQVEKKPSHKSDDVMAPRGEKNKFED